MRQNMKKIKLLLVVALVCALVSTFVGCGILDGGPSSDAEFVNNVCLNAMSANFTVYATNSNFSGYTKSVGSSVAFFFDAAEGEYYLLTNNHVVAVKDGFDSIDLVVNDYKGNEYDVEEVVAQDPEFDLAIIKFSVSSDDPTYATLKVAAANPTKNSKVAAIGQPHGQLNALTLGKVLGYSATQLDGISQKLSNVTFPVLCHSAPINTGSSGGAVLNAELKIVGINYATAFDEDKDSADSNGKFKYGAAIPAEKIREFIAKYKLDGLL